MNHRGLSPQIYSGPRLSVSLLSSYSGFVRSFFFDGCLPRSGAYAVPAAAFPASAVVFPASAAASSFAALRFSLLSALRLLPSLPCFHFRRRGFFCSRRCRLFRSRRRFFVPAGTAYPVAPAAKTAPVRPHPCAPRFLPSAFPPHLRRVFRRCRSWR